MNSAKKVILRIILLAIILIAMNLVYKYFFYEKDLQKYSDVINLVRAVSSKTDIVYIGESSNFSYHEDDIDIRKISEMISDYFPGLNVADITKPASHAGIYKKLLSKIPNNSNISTVVVTLNLRSFNAQWKFSNLETSLQKSMVLLRDYPPLVNRFLLSFKDYDIKSKKEREHQFVKKWEKDDLNFPYVFPHKNVREWDKWMAYTGIKDADGNIDQGKTELACHYIKGYAFQIDTNNDIRIKDFDGIIKLSEKRGWNLVFNLLSENTQMAQELVGKDLIYLMEQNRTILKTYFQKRGVVVVDNLFAVETTQFIDQNWTTEHYAEKGRKIIANNVALSIKDFYPKEYKKVDYSNTIQSSFFNDCEKQTTWWEMQTITDENAFSGKYSSITGLGNDYSITFKYPIKVIPDTLKNIITINCKLFQHSFNHDAKIVIQAANEDTDFFWSGISIKEQLNKTNVWEDFNYTLKIPENILAADLIKLYLYNPSNEIVLIDDIKIEFK